MAVVTADAEAWIDLLLKRGPELRKAGVLSIGVDGMSAVLAPAEPAADPATAGDDTQGENAEADEPTNPWENPASYPSGHVPTLGDVEPADQLPPIPTFGEG